MQTAFFYAVRLSNRTFPCLISETNVPIGSYQRSTRRSIHANSWKPALTGKRL